MKEVAEQRVRAASPAAAVRLSVAAVPPIPFSDSTFDAVFIAFTLELFPDDTIPLVLREVRRTLRLGGRLGIVSMALDTVEDHHGMPERIYAWMHRHFPHIVDCRPIDAERWLAQAGLAVARVERLEIWGLPVVVIVAHNESAAASGQS